MVEDKSESNENNENLTLQEIHERLEEERIKDLSPAPWASAKDYIKLQGGIPSVIFDNNLNLTTITHDYLENSPQVTSHKTIEEYGTTKINPENPRSYATSLLWSKHGGPCEVESKKRGGEGYNRKKKP